MERQFLLAEPDSVWLTVHLPNIVENEEHCEFLHLRNFLTRTHLQDLIETTSLIHYETFRTRQLLALKESSKGDDGQ
jgi:septin family protein